MIKYLTLFHKSFLPFQPHFNIIIIPGSQQKFKYQFLSQLKGQQVQQHIIPNSSVPTSIKLHPQLYKFHKKYSPNYLVALINKCSNKNTTSTTLERSQTPSTISPIDQFYNVCTYCSVKYHENNHISLEAIYRVKIQHITKQIIQPSQQTFSPSSSPPSQNCSQPTNQSPDSKQQKQKHQNKTVNSNSTKQSFYPLYCYSLKVKKLDNPPFKLTPKIQNKYKFLAESFLNGFPFLQQQAVKNARNFLFNLHNIHISMDILAIAFKQCSQKKQLIQNYLESNDVEQKIDILEQILNQKNKIMSTLRQLEIISQENIRKKKFYQYYLQTYKTGKKLLTQGKKPHQLRVQQINSSFYNMKPPENVIKVFCKQLQKFATLQQNSAQGDVSKKYLQQLSKIPYNVITQQNLDLDFAKRALDQEHYGMKQVKEMILQIIAVGKLKKTLKGKIFCLIGGTGTGKTSFARSVAKALNRKFQSISLGGMVDSSYLKGHSRTYVGAYSGKIIAALKNCETRNPVILLDQIDKVGKSYQGDPRSQLLQILDPNQNNSFVDNYVNAPVDLSDVLFITSANYQGNISKPLLDRMHKIYLDSYTKHEKVQIFSRFLLERAILQTGVTKEQFSISPQVIQHIVSFYNFRQPGVRSLSRHAITILQKVAYKLVNKQQQPPIKITIQNLHEYIGYPHHLKKDHLKISEGVAISLGGGSYQSRLTYIEAFRKSFITKKQINKNVLFTGSLGSVFKQAMNISFTFARNFLLQHLNNRFLFQNDVHIHATEGAFKKDGSNDSMTIVAALISLAMSTKVKSQVALTGQITLYGRTLRTHNIKQKIIVAKRQQIKEIILPKDNQSEIENLTPDLKEGLQFHFVTNFLQAFVYLFPDQPILINNNIKKLSHHEKKCQQQSNTASS